MLKLLAGYYTLKERQKKLIALWEIMLQFNLLKSAVYNSRFDLSQQKSQKDVPQYYTHSENLNRIKLCHLSKSENNL